MKLSRGTQAFYWLKLCNRGGGDSKKCLLWEHVERTSVKRRPVESIIVVLRETCSQEIVPQSNISGEVAIKETRMECRRFATVNLSWQVLSVKVLGGGTKEYNSSEI